MKEGFVFVIAIFLLSQCGEIKYHAVDADNPPYYPNTVFKEFEDLTSPRFKHLIEKFRLDTIFHGETDEFKRILLLRHWIKSDVTGPEHRIIIERYKTNN